MFKMSAHICLCDIYAYNWRIKWHTGIWNLIPFPRFTLSFRGQISKSKVTASQSSGTKCTSADSSHSVLKLCGIATLTKCEMSRCTHKVSGERHKLRLEMYHYYWPPFGRNLDIAGRVTYLTIHLVTSTEKSFHFWRIVCLCVCFPVDKIAQKVVDEYLLNF